jgi:hypothetical protein
MYNCNNINYEAKPKVLPLCGFVVFHLKSFFQRRLRFVILLLILSLPPFFPQSNRIPSMVLYINKDYQTWIIEKSKLRLSSLDHRGSAKKSILIGSHNNFKNLL